MSYYEGEVNDLEMVAYIDETESESTNSFVVLAGGIVISLAAIKLLQTRSPDANAKRKEESEFEPPRLYLPVTI